VSGLTAQDRHVIGLARQLAVLATVAAVREHAGTDDTVIALAHFWGAARVSLADVVAIAERRGDDEDQAPGDTRRLAEIRAIFAAFDWERDDRQYALEAIEMIAATGDDGQEDDGTHACAACGALVGIFQGRSGWQHYRGDGTAASPVEIYDAGHEATFAAGQEAGR